MLEVGDKLIFYLEKPPKNMHVQVVPKERFGVHDPHFQQINLTLILG